MAKGVKREQREPAKKPADAPSSARRREPARPPGYLPTADPPRKNRWALWLSAVLLLVWMLVLAWLAFFG